MKSTVVVRLTGLIVIQCGDVRHSISDMHTPLGATITCPEHSNGADYHVCRPSRKGSR